MTVPASQTRIQAILDELIRSRRELTTAGADVGLLEANRLGIVYWQGQLARARLAEKDRGSAAA